MSAQVDVQWKLTIPHPRDVLQTGVRVAVHYGVEDSFDKNILAGHLDGDDTNNEKVSAGPKNAARDSIQTVTVTLPAGKTCNYCTIQWLWAAKHDGGYYLGCADIAITADRSLPNYSKLPSQKGNALPVAADTPPLPGPKPGPPKPGPKRKPPKQPKQCRNTKQRIARAKAYATKLQEHMMARMKRAEAYIAKLYQQNKDCKNEAEEAEEPLALKRLTTATDQWDEWEEA